MQIHVMTGATPGQAAGGARGTGAPPQRPAGEGDGGQPHERGPRGLGLMVQALKQTLSQLGLPSSTDTSTDTSTGSSTATSPAVVPRTTERGDLHALMHALFQAVRATRGSGSTPPAGPPPDLASALGTLATQATAGQAPAELQEAFEAVTQGLQSGSGGDSSVTLSSFLQTLQQQLRSGGATPMVSSGQVLQVQA